MPFLNAFYLIRLKLLIILPASRPPFSMLWTTGEGWGSGGLAHFPDRRE